MRVGVGLSVAEFGEGNVGLSAARADYFRGHFVNRPESEVEVVDILFDILVARSPGEGEPSEQLVADVFGDEILRNVVPTSEVFGLVAQADDRCDVADLTVAHAGDCLLNCGLVAHLRAAEYAQTLFVGERNKFVVNFSELYGVDANRLFGEDVLARVERLFDVEGAEDWRGHEGDDVGVRLENLVDCVESDKGGVGLNLPDFFGLESEAFCEIRDDFAALLDLLHIDVARRDEFDVLVGGKHILERARAASAAAYDCDFNLVRAHRCAERKFRHYKPRRACEGCRFQKLVSVHFRSSYLNNWLFVCVANIITLLPEKYNGHKEFLFEIY